jgi:hypothetical protein
MNDNWESNCSQCRFVQPDKIRVEGQCVSRLFDDLQSASILRIEGAARGNTLGARDSQFSGWRSHPFFESRYGQDADIYAAIDVFLR